MMTENNNSSKELLLSSLNTFYNNNNIYKLTLKTIIDGKHELSLRMIDWLVTRYAKTNNIIYWINDIDQDIYENLPENHNNEKYKKITLYLDYRAQLKSFKKFNFDAFRRHDRIIFKINEEEDIETTIGQLNFFKWAFNTKIITYALENQKKIYENMSKFSYKKQIKISNKNSLVPKQDIINTKCYVIFD
jgi:hypothetical protein